MRSTLGAGRPVVGGEARAGTALPLVLEELFVGGNGNRPPSGRRAGLAQRAVAAHAAKAGDAGAGEAASEAEAPSPSPRRASDVMKERMRALA